MAAYYNEIDPYAAQWMRNLIQAGHIADGLVDERSIEDVTPDDLRGFTQCHFFAGLGGWSLALRSGGWSDARPVWTGSCPCQPFSAAGKGGGFADERHLWPAFDWLIGQCRPDLVLGEQVEGPAGRTWLDLVATDLEGHGYAFGTAVFPAAGVGAPQIRHRTYWVADADVQRETREELGETDSGWPSNGPVGSCSPDRRPGPVNGFWRASDWLYCRDDKWRPVEPGTFPLATGAPARVGRLRAYGNAICVPQAVAFVEAVIAAPTVLLDTQELAAE